MSREMNERTNKADLLGSLIYNINASTGFALGVGPDDHYLYSDGITGTPHPKDYITGEEIDESSIDVGSFLTYDHTMFIGTLDNVDYYKGDWFLFGISWLPWFPPPAKPDGKGRYRRYDMKYNTVFNKARSDVLIPTMITIGKVTGIAVGTYYGLKLGWRLARDRGLF